MITLVGVSGTYKSVQVSRRKIVRQHCPFTSVSAREIPFNSGSVAKSGCGSTKSAGGDTPMQIIDAPKPAAFIIGSAS